MRFVFIDLGSYSLKISIMKGSKKSAIVEQFYEHFRKNISLESDIEFIARYLQDNKLIGEKIVLFAPFYFTTHRQMTFSGLDKKKAELSIPFQLEDTTPFVQGKSHFSVQFHEKKDLFALVEVGLLDEFVVIVKNFYERNIKLHSVTTESACVEFSLIEKGIDTCCFVDIGHFSTKLYFFHDHRLVFIESSSRGGFHLTEAIKDFYKISEEEAVMYKHQNSFVLTEQQKKSATEDQVVFSEVLEKEFDQIFRDFNRMEMSFRVMTGKSIDSFIITGGSSEIKNLDNFFTDKTGISVQKMLYKKKFDDKSVLVSTRASVPPMKNSFYKSYLYMESLLYKEKLLNFLKNLKIEGFEDRISLNSIIFIFSRSIILTLFLISYFFFEKSYLESFDNNLSKKIVEYVKKENIDIEKKTLDTFLKNSESFDKKIKKDLKDLEIIILIGKKTLEEKSLQILEKVLTLRLEQSNYLEKFISSGDKVSLKFKEKNDEVLKTSLRKNFQNIKINEESDSLDVEIL